MANFNTMQITNAGKTLYAKVQTGVQLNFTKIQLGSGNIGTQNPETLTALVTPQFNVAIQSVSADTTNKQATISGTFTNTSVTATTYICEIGIFAQDPDNGEILYGYASAGSQGDYINPASSGAFSNNYQVIAAVGNATSVKATISNLQYDYAVVNSGTYTFLVGGNQKEINKSIDNLIKPYTTTNAGNIYSITVSNITATDISLLQDGYPLTVKFNAASTGVTSLKINSLTAKGIVDYFENPVTNIRQNLIANLRYEATSGNFILLGKGGGGTADPTKVLAPYTFTSDAGTSTGTISSKSAQTYNPSISAQTIASGQYLSGAQTIAAVGGNATINDVVSGKTFSSANGINLTGQATIQSLGGTEMYTASDSVIPNYSNNFLTLDLSGIGFDPKVITGTFTADGGVNDAFSCIRNLNISLVAFYNDTENSYDYTAINICEPVNAIRIFERFSSTQTFVNPKVTYQAWGW